MRNLKKLHQSVHTWKADCTVSEVGDYAAPTVLSRRPAAYQALFFRRSVEWHRCRKFEFLTAAGADGPNYVHNSNHTWPKRITTHVSMLARFRSSFVGTRGHAVSVGAWSAASLRTKEVYTLRYTLLCCTQSLLCVRTMMTASSVGTYVRLTNELTTVVVIMFVLSSVRSNSF